jgi:hypothetical protein
MARLTDGKKHGQKQKKKSVFPSVREEKLASSMKSFLPQGVQAEVENEQDPLWTCHCEPFDISG